MSKILTNTLNINVNTRDDNNSHVSSRVVKGKYDFEKFLFDENNKINVSSDSGVPGISEHDIELKSNDLNSRSLPEVFSNNKGTIDKQNAGGGSFNSLPGEKITFPTINKLNKALQYTNNGIANFTKNTSEFNSLINDINTSKKYKIVFTPKEEAFRLIKSDGYYTLYLNVNERCLSESRLSGVLKIIEKENNISLNKVVVNREVMLDRQKNTSNVSDRNFDSKSEVNIKI